MKTIYAVTLLSVFTSIVAYSEIPTFSLLQQNDGSHLSWLSHRVYLYQEGLDDNDHIIIEAKDDITSLGLTWHSMPEKETGKCLGTSLYWKIPSGILDQQTYDISCERKEDEHLVFRIIDRKSGIAKLRSPKLKLTEKYVGDMETVLKNAHRIEILDISGLIENEQ